ncbi:MAG: twin-arginine translocase TatA/TatE family subunit [Flavobacteriales bacterium]|nr:twin-arginine translocase TatA/TatE family subunit [Flavobacteriales bacterium]|tara:strand:+ start:378 stop:578 length:201 start_codon:yes stop_codon:yes gene_type:complete
MELASLVKAGMIGPQQIIIIVVLIVLLFGAKKIPELMKGVGKGIKEFKDAANNDEKGEKEEKDSKS